MLLQAFTLLTLFYISLTYAQGESNIRPSTSINGNKVRREIQEVTLAHQLYAIIMHIKSEELAQANDKITQLPTLPLKRSFFIIDTHFHILIKYIEQLNTPATGLILLNAIWANMKHNLDFNFDKLTTLYAAFASEVINKPEADINLKMNATIAQKNVSVFIVIIAAEIIKQPILGSSYQSTDMSKKVERLLFDKTSDEVLENTIRKVIEDVYPIADKLKLIDYNAFGHHYRRVAVAMEHIFKMMQKNGDFNDDATIRLGYLLKEAGGKHSHTLSKHRLDNIKAAFNNLPKIVQALFNREEICIYSDYGMSLSSCKLSSVSEGDYNKVCVSNSSLESVKFEDYKWRAESVYGYGFHFRLINEGSKEYMLAGESDRVFTSGLKTDTDARFGWFLHWHGNEFVIKNEESQQYLCAGAAPPLEDSEKEVFIAPKAGECKWKIQSNTNCRKMK